jgi:two-component system CheB/CheR fusion protein
MDAIIAQGFDGRILSWNPAAERVYGYTQTQALTMNVRQLIPEEAMADWERTSDLIRQGQPVEPYRTRRRARDGRELAVWLVPTALLGDDDKPYALGTTERYLRSPET